MQEVGQGGSGKLRKGPLRRGLTTAHEKSRAFYRPASGLGL